jgi:hypothetical protein
LFRPHSRGAFLVCFCAWCGYNLLNLRHMKCSLHLPPPRQL